MQDLSAQALGRTFAAALCLLASTLACASGLQRTSSGFKVSGPDYSIKALPSGALMPPGWVLVDYEERDGKFARTQRHDPNDFAMKRENGSFQLSLTSGLSDCEWESNPTVCIEREYASPELGMPGSAMLGSKGQRIVVTSSRPRNFFGGYGVEITSERVAIESGAVLAREYRFWFHKYASNRSVVLRYSAPAATFMGGARDVAELVARISF